MVAVVVVVVVVVVWGNWLVALALGNERARLPTAPAASLDIGPPLLLAHLSLSQNHLHRLLNSLELNANLH